MLLRTKALLVGCTLLLAACEPEPAEPAAPLSVTSFSFNLVDTSGAPLADVNVAEMVDGSAFLLGQTGDAGHISVVDHETGQLTVTFAKDGYAPQVWTGDLQAPQTERIVMIAREAAQTIPAGEAADVEGKDGASVEVAADAFVSADGLPYAGSINVTITPVDIASDATEAAAFPGSFNAVLESGAEQPLITYGTVEYHFTDESGNELQLAEGQAATIEIPVYTLTHPDGSTIQVGDVIPFWYLDEETGIWHEDGEGTVVASESSPTGLAQRGQVSHFTWWNCDVSPNPATVTIETTLPDVADREYRLDYRVVPMSSRYSSVTNSDIYLGGGIATFDSYIPEDTQVEIEVVLYKYADEQRTSYRSIARESISRFFAAGSETTITFDFSDSDSEDDAAQSDPVATLFDIDGSVLEDGADLGLVIGAQVNFAFAQVDGALVTDDEADHDLIISSGPDWLQDLLTERGAIDYALDGIVPEFSTQEVVFSLVNNEGQIVQSISLNLIALDALSAVVDNSLIFVEKDGVAPVPSVSVAGGYPPYNISLVPVSDRSADLFSLTGSYDAGYEVTGLEEGVGLLRYYVSDSTGKLSSSQLVPVSVIEFAPLISPVGDVEATAGTSIDIVPVIETGVVSFWSLEGDLPEGLVFDADNGSISGSTDIVGSFELTIVAENIVGSSSANFVIYSNPLPITPFDDYYLDLPAVTGVTGSEWILTAGELPSGLILDSSAGTISGAAEVSGFYSLTFEVDGEIVSFTLFITEISNSAPIVSLFADDVVRLGGFTQADITVSDLDGDETSITAEVISGAEFVSDFLVTNNRIKLSTKPDAIENSLVTIRITAADTRGATTSIDHTFNIERQPLQPGRLLGGTGVPQIEFPRVVDTGDYCALYSESGDFDKSDVGSEFKAFDKLENRWLVDIALSNSGNWVLDVADSDEIVIWGGYNALDGSDSEFKSPRAGFIDNGKLTYFESLPLDSEDSAAVIDEVLPVVTTTDELRVFISIADKGIFVSDDSGLSWAAVFSGEYESITANRMHFINGQIYLYGTVLSSQGYPNEVLLISSDGGFSWVDTALNSYGTMPGPLDMAEDSETGTMVAVGRSYTSPSTFQRNPGISFSTNGTEWTRISPLPPVEGDVFDASTMTFSQVDFADGVWTAVGYWRNRSVVVSSIDGMNWNILHASTDAEAVISEVSTCTGSRLLLATDGLTYRDITGLGEYVADEPAPDVLEWSFPLDGARFASAYTEEYLLEGDVLRPNGVIAYQSEDGVAWTTDQVSVDGVYTESLSASSIYQTTASEWLWLTNGEEPRSSVDGVNFVPYTFPAPEPESVPEALMNVLDITENYSTLSSAGISFTGVNISSDGGVWYIDRINEEWSFELLGNLNDVVPGIAFDNIRSISVVHEDNFYIVFDETVGDVSVSSLVQYAPERGLTYETGCWFNEMCLWESQITVLQPVSEGHFVSYALPYFGEVGAVQSVKSVDGVWLNRDIDVDVNVDVADYSMVFPDVLTDLAGAQPILSMFGVGVMVYDEANAMLTGVLSIDDVPVESIMRNGDQLIAVTAGYLPQAHVLPLDAFSNAVTGTEPAPEIAQPAAGSSTVEYDPDAGGTSNPVDDPSNYI